jgi:hypothetical protein
MLSGRRLTFTVSMSARRREPPLRERNLA